MLDSDKMDLNLEVSPFVDVHALPLEPGALLQVTEPHRKSKSEELNLEVGQIITLIEMKTDGWWRGVKDIGTSSPEMGWFPSSKVIECIEEMHSTSQRPSVESSRPSSPINLPLLESTSTTPLKLDDQKRSRAGSWYQKVFAKAPSTASLKIGDRKSKRERSVSVPSTLTVDTFAFKLDPLPSVDSTIAALDKSDSESDLKTPAMISNSINNDTNYASNNQQWSPMDAFKKQFSLKSFPTPLVIPTLRGHKINPAFKELVDTEWNYLQDLKLYDVIFRRHSFLRRLTHHPPN
jgi:hypothetical protein